MKPKTDKQGWEYLLFLAIGLIAYYLFSEPLGIFWIVISAIKTTRND